MALPKPRPAAGEAAAAVTMVKRAQYSGWNRSRSRAYLRDLAIGVVSHYHAGCVACQPLGRFGGNAGAFDDRLAWGTRIGQDRGVHVDNNLVALAGGPGVH